jgi:hypothetical protein
LGNSNNTTMIDKENLSSMANGFANSKRHISNNRKFAFDEESTGGGRVTVSCDGENVQDTSRRGSVNRL